jgi:hypothetical protein
VAVQDSAEVSGRGLFLQGQRPLQFPFHQNQGVVCGKPAQGYDPTLAPQFALRRGQEKGADRRSVHQRVHLVSYQLNVIQDDEGLGVLECVTNLDGRGLEGYVALVKGIEKRLEQVG